MPDLISNSASHKMYVQFGLFMAMFIYNFNTYTAFANGVFSPQHRGRLNANEVGITIITVQTYQLVQQYTLTSKHSDRQLIN